ncbi:MAG: Na(+)/H(+) antiporter subunit D, partial [Candidatus Thermoplasmatota archaeon]
MGVALSSNLFGLLVFYEVLTIATYPLVVHRESEEAYRAGRKYLVYTLGGGAAIVAAIGVTAGMQMAAGMAVDLSFAANGNPSLAALPVGAMQAVAFLLVAGFGVKATLVPLHGWLPSAMVAPTPVSGLLHAVAIVKAGVFGELRTILFFLGPGLTVSLGVQPWLLAFAAATILFGSVLALAQDNLKLRLAYSTISQLSYIVLGAALLTPSAIVGATFQIAAHAFAKLTMFFVAGAILVETGKTNVSELDGIGRRMPRTMLAFAFATLGMAALPPVAGFIAKWYLGVGAWEAGDWWVLLVLVASSVLNLAYFLPIVIRAFFGPSEGVRRQEARGTLSWPLTATAAGAVILGLFTAIPYGPFDLARRVAAEVTGAAVAPFTFVPNLTPFIPPFLIFLIGAPIVLALKGRARQVGLVVVAALGLLDTLFMPAGTSWTVPFLDGELVLLRADALSMFTAYIFAIITFLAVLYAAFFAKKWLHLYALLYAGASMGAVFAGDWITLLIFWELMAVTSTLLIWENKGEAIRAGYRYLLFHGFGGAMLAAGAALAFLDQGDLVLGPVTNPWSTFFLLMGIGVNVAFIPLHTWLPDSYPKAHIAASVFLSVYTTKAAVYLLARVVTGATPGVEYVALMGAVMAVYGVSFAVVQNNMRKLLSYHIVSQVGYMVAGVGIGAAYATSLGTNGGMAHVFNNILYKPLLFMTIGVVIWKTGQHTLDKLGGLQRKMPITALAFWIAAFSISGVPGFNGYVSKGMVITAAEEHSLLLWVLLEIASFGTFLSFLKLGWFAFLRPGKVEASDPPRITQAAMLGTAALCVFLGIYPAIQFAYLPVSGMDYQPFELIRFLETVAVLGAAAVFFFSVGRKVLAPHDTRLEDAD